MPVADERLAEHSVAVAIGPVLWRHAAGARMGVVLRRSVALGTRGVIESIRRAVNHSGGCEGATGVHAVVAAGALFVDVETVNARGNAGEVGDDFDAIVACILELNDAFRGRAAGRVERGRRHRSFAMGTCGE